MFFTGDLFLGVGWLVVIFVDYWTDVGVIFLFGRVVLFL